MKASLTSGSRRPDTHGPYVTFMPVDKLKCQLLLKTNILIFLVNEVSESQKIRACADGMFEQAKREKTQYLQTPALERRTKRVIPGFRPVRSLLDAVGPSLLSATDLASRYGIEREICRPLNHM